MPEYEIEFENLQLGRVLVTAPNLDAALVLFEADPEGFDIDWWYEENFELRAAHQVHDGR